ncbi:hypothetical protein J3R83DRAFT_10343 [Lanmaoa asiatica]|nr:hypothetical protein J3R83DRAFT_10343 [Lanmaoa asiatica]
MARQALLALGLTLGKAKWEEVLQPLCDSDMRHMTDMLDGQMEGRRDLLWIWKMPGVLGSSDADL